MGVYIYIINEQKPNMTTHTQSWKNIIFQATFIVFSHVKKYDTTKKYSVFLKKSPHIDIKSWIWLLVGRIFLHAGRLGP